MNEEPVRNDKFPESEGEVPESTDGRTGSRWPKVAAAFFFCAMVAGIAYAVYERAQAERLSANDAQMNAALIQTQNELVGLTAKLNALATPRQIAAPAAPTSVAGGQEGKHQARALARTRRRKSEDLRWKQMQSQLADQQKQIAAAQQNIDQARSELEGELNSTHDELSGSIARSHDELVALEKRGQRSFYEFDLTKSKQFQRVGPIGIALRKANTRHLYCDLNLLVDDNELNKKHVSLYEPVQFYPTDYAQPLEIVIYKINKNEARGYVSAPKYRQSELAAQQTSSTATSPLPGTAVPAKTADLARRPEEPRQ
jgi:hypothetical protein